MASMYRRLGGGQAFEAAVEEFYRRVLGDVHLRHHFGGADVKRLKGHQQAFLAMALGGPKGYIGRSLTAAHWRLSIDDEAFDRTMEHLVATLVDLGLPGDDVREIGANLLPLRHDIVHVAAPAAPSSAPEGGESLFEPDRSNADNLTTPR